MPNFFLAVWRGVRGAARLVAVSFMLILLFAANSCNAQCIQGPRSSTNKSMHLLGEMAVTTIATDLTGSLKWGVGIGVAVGAAREIHKARTPGMACETSSMLYDAAGIAIGAGIGRVVLQRKDGGGVQVSLTVPLQ